MNTGEEPKRQPARYLRFGVRSLLVAMLAVAAYLGGRKSMLPELSRTKQDLELAQERLEAAYELFVVHSPQTNSTNPDRIDFDALVKRRKYIPKLQKPTPKLWETGSSEDLAEKINIAERYERFQNQINVQSGSE